MPVKSRVPEYSLEIGFDVIRSFTNYITKLQDAHYLLVTVEKPYEFPRKQWHF
jgi:hypothetical protein